MNFTIFQEKNDTIIEGATARPWTKKTFCPYCYKEATHFSRHLERNHKDEGAVMELRALPSGTKKRKILLDAMRKQGHYLLNSKFKVLRPMRLQKSSTNNDINDNSNPYTSCQDCFGFYKRNALRRHRKKCSLRENITMQRENHLSDSQKFMICSGQYSDLYNSLRLKDEVFGIMRNDEISKTAMSDPLVCIYAEGLLSKHKNKHIRNCISNKMRELGRLLITLRKTTAIPSLFSALRPEYFDNLVAATKIISGFNLQTKTYEAGSLAMHMGTTLKQVCQTATKLVIKKSPFIEFSDEEKTLKGIERLGNLINNHWATDVSSLALKSLNEIRWKKPKLLPLTSSIMKFQQFCTNEAESAAEKIKSGTGLNEEYRRLAENVLALTLLLNRKRIGEVQYMQVETYKNSEIHRQPEEFLNSLTETEKFLAKSFKRVVTRGKGNKPVAILFPKSIKNFIEIMLSVRHECVPESNEFLFGNPNTENSWMSGYHVLRKLASQAQIDEPDLITSTKLRKHIATILQVLNVKDIDKEQFASFMGHTMKTHDEFYR